MNLITVSIDEFPQDGAPWRIDGLGRLHRTGGLLSESLIDVHLSELVPYYEDPLKNGSLGTRTKRVPVKVGFMALLKLGSVWINKVRCLAKLPPKTMSVRVAPEQVELRTWGSTIEFEGRTIPLIAKNQFYIPTDNWRDLAESWVVFIRRPLPNVPYLIIPSSVIFQKCLAVSPEGIRRLVRGELHRIIDNPHPIDTGDGVKSYFVELAKEIPSAHAYAYANLAADPSGRREYERMRRTLVAASVNEDRGRNSGSQSFLSIGLPFSNPVCIHLHGKLMPYKREPLDNKVEFAFLATEMRISDFLDIKFDIVDTVFGTAVSEVLLPPSRTPSGPWIVGYSMVVLSGVLDPARRRRLAYTSSLAAPTRSAFPGAKPGLCSGRGRGEQVH